MEALACVRVMCACPIRICAAGRNGLVQPLGWSFFSTPFSPDVGQPFALVGIRGPSLEVGVFVPVLEADLPYICIESKASVRIC